MTSTTPAPDPDYTGREDRVFSAGLLAPNLRFIRKFFGADVEERLYEVWGVSREEAADTERWITYDTALALNKAIVQVTGDPEVLYKAGLLHAETAEVGVVFYLAKLLASPKAVYARIPSMGRSLSRITHFELLELKDGEAVFEFHVSEGYPDHPLFDQKRRGTLAAIPLSFDLPAATITEEACMNRGDPTCIYRVRWQTPGSKLTLGLVAMAGGAALGAALALPLDDSPILGAVVGLVLGTGITLARYGFHRLRLALDRIRTQEGEIEALEHMAGSRSEQAARLEVLREISDLLHSAKDEDQLITTATELVARRLDFERVLFWKAIGDKLVAVSGTGMSQQVAAGMGQLWLPRYPDLDGRAPDLPLFGLVLETLRGRRINDVAAFRTGLSERGRQLLDRLSPGPFIVVPVQSEGEGVGLLAAERSRQGSQVNDADQSLLQQVANQLGLALDNVRMLEDLRHQRRDLQNALLLNQKYSVYLPSPVVDKLRQEPEAALELGGKTIRATVLFSDIKGFTQWSRKREPAAVVDGLNRYFAAMDDIIADTGGILDKRMGDGLMVVFLHTGGDGEPVAQHPAARALHCAQRMQRAVDLLAAAAEPEGFPGLQVRIGVAHGDLVAGNLGSRHRIEYTVIGDVVNVASRLEQLCPPGGVATTGDTLRRAEPATFSAHSLGKRELPGREGAVEVMQLELSAPA